MWAAGTLRQSMTMNQREHAINSLIFIALTHHSKFCITFEDKAAPVKDADWNQSIPPAPDAQIFCVCLCGSSFVWRKSGPPLSLWAVLWFDVEFDDWGCLISEKTHTHPGVTEE